MTSPSTQIDDDHSATGTEPAQLRMSDWVAAIERGDSAPYRPAGEADWSRRRLGILICAVALIYPAYSYLVQRTLLLAEVAAAQETLKEELRRLSEELTPTRRVRPNPTSAPLRPPPVRVVGVIDGPNPPPSPNSTAAPPAKSPPASAYRPSSG